MFGFHKEDVARFIASQSKSHEKELLELKKDQEILVADYEKKIHALSENLEKMSTIREESEKQQNAFLRLREGSEQIEEALDKILVELSEKEKQVSLVNDNNSELENRLEKAMTLCDKANRFDQLASVLSGIVSGQDPVTVQPEVLSLDPVASVDPIDLTSLRTSVEELNLLYKKVFASVEELNRE
jgi:DNA repair exonuclease SbcCD ATPase subunit